MEWAAEGQGTAALQCMRPKKSHLHKFQTCYSKPLVVLSYSYNIFIQKWFMEMVSNGFETNFCFRPSNIHWQRPLALSQSFPNAALKLLCILSLVTMICGIILEMESKGLDSVYLSSAIIPHIQNGFSLEHGHRQRTETSVLLLFHKKKMNLIFLEDYIKYKQRALRSCF